MLSQEVLIAALLLGQIVSGGILKVLDTMLNRRATNATAIANAEATRAKADAAEASTYGMLLKTVQEFSGFVNELIVQRQTQDERIRVVTEQVTELQVKLRESQLQIERLKNELAAKDARISELEKSEKAQQKALEELKIQRAADQKQMQALEEENRKLRARLDTMNGANNEHVDDPAANMAATAE